MGASRPVVRIDGDGETSLSPVRQSLIPLKELYEFLAKPSATCSITHHG